MKRANMRTVQDEQGYNQGWAGGRATDLRAERRCDLMISKMTTSPTRKVLEIGCGRGEIARYLGARTGMQVLGVDRDQGFVDEARAKTTESNVRFECADFTKPTGLLDDRFDYITGNGILHHLYYGLEASLQKIRRLLADGGRIIFLEPNLHNPYVFLIFSRPGLRRRARLEPDEMAFSRRFAIDRLAAAGFSEIEVDYRDFLVPGLPDQLIGPVVWGGRIAEQTPGLKHLAQSLFISARG